MRGGEECKMELSVSEEELNDLMEMCIQEQMETHSEEMQVDQQGSKSDCGRRWKFRKEKEKGKASYNEDPRKEFPVNQAPTKVKLKFPDANKNKLKIAQARLFGKHDSNIFPASGLQQQEYIEHPELPESVSFQLHLGTG